MSEHMAIFIVELFGVLAVFAGIAWGIRRWKTERLAVLSEVRNDDANAAKAYAEARGVILENQQKMFTLLSQHNQEFLTLHERIRQLEKQVHVQEGDLVKERQRNILLQEENTTLKAQVQELRQQVKALTQRINQLEGKGCD